MSELKLVQKLIHQMTLAFLIIVYILLLVKMNLFLELIETEKGLQGYLKMVEKYFPEDKQKCEEYFSEIPIALDYF